MSYELTAQISTHLDVTERANSAISPASAAGGNARVFNQYATDIVLTGNTSTSFPAIGNPAIDLSCTIGGGLVRDFDLRSAPQANDISRNVDLVGKKLVAIQIRTGKSNNAAGVTFGPQGGNGYALFGASKTPIFFPGANLVLAFADPDQADAAFALATPAVAAGAKDLRFSGANGDTVECLAIFSA